MVAGSAKYLEERRSLRTKASANTVIFGAVGVLEIVGRADDLGPVATLAARD
jgi:hypothetical protein